MIKFDFMKKLVLCIFLLSAAAVSAVAQDYVATPVTVSKEKVKLDGKLYYTHVVLERQTLFGISKAYEVSIDEILDANEAIGLRENGLKKNSIILIPVPEKRSAKETARDIAKGRKDRGRTDGEPSEQAVSEQVTVSPEEATVPEVTVPGATAPTVDEDQSAAVPDTMPAVDTVIAEEMPASVMEPSPKRSVAIKLLLPFNIESGKGTAGFMDFYSGALLAARMKGEQGIDIDLDVRDVTQNVPDFSEAEFASTDVVIGPVSLKLMSEMESKAPAGTCLVSPLDAKTICLADSCSTFIQVHGDNFDHYSDVISWLKDEFVNGDKVLVISEEPKWDSDLPAVKACLDSTGLAYSSMSYNILQGRNIISNMKDVLTKDAVNRIVLVSESEAFVNDVLRNISLLTHAKYNIALYGAPRVRSFDTIEAEHLHKANLHIAPSYFVDYDDPSVKDFIMKYRAVFRTEPTSYSYQGYDIISFFVDVITRYGDNWINWLDSETGRCLQTDFHFERVGECGGFVNRAQRRVVYGPDYSVKLYDR